MPLPALRADGTLPPGAHAATLAEVLAAFPATTPERRALNQALSQCVATVRRLNLAQQIAVDGSYATERATPGDVDLVVLTPGLYQLAGERRFLAEGIDLKLLDIQFAYDAADFQGWLGFFSLARSGAQKGIIV
ncbi:MAG: DUF6932 family protein, partial [Ktedonobacterales bacterium]